MQVEIKIDDSCIEPKVIIITDKVNDEINDILNTLSSKTPEVITGFYNDLAEILSPEDIIRIYAAGEKGAQLRFELIGYNLRYAVRRYGNICFKTLCVKNQTGFRFIGGKL